MVYSVSKSWWSQFLFSNICSLFRFPRFLAASPPWDRSVREAFTFLNTFRPSEIICIIFSCLRSGNHSSQYDLSFSITFPQLTHQEGPVIDTCHCQGKESQYTCPSWANCWTARYIHPSRSPGSARDGGSWGWPAPDALLPRGWSKSEQASFSFILQTPLWSDRLRARSTVCKVFMVPNRLFLTCHTL